MPSTPPPQPSPDPHAAPRLKARPRTTRAGIGPWLVLPTIAALGLFVYRPLVRGVELSFYGSDLLGNASRFIGLSGWKEFLGSPDLRRVLGASLTISVLAMLLAVGFALVCTLLLRPATPGQGVFAAIFSLPFAYSAASASAVFYGLLGPSVGAIGLLLQRFGLQAPPFLQDPTSAIISIAVTTAWYESGFAFLVLLAATRELPLEVLEAASLDGAGDWRTNWSIVIPLIRSSLFFLVVTQTISGLQIFTQVYVLTRGGPSNATTTLVYELYQVAFGQGTPDFGRASIISTFLVLVITAVTVLQFRIARRSR